MNSRWLCWKLTVCPWLCLCGGTVTYFICSHYQRKKQAIEHMAVLGDCRHGTGRVMALMTSDREGSAPHQKAWIVSCPCPPHKRASAHRWFLWGCSKSRSVHSVCASRQGLGSPSRSTDQCSSLQAAPSARTQTSTAHVLETPCPVSLSSPVGGFFSFHCHSSYFTEGSLVEEHSLQIRQVPDTGPF